MSSGIEKALRRAKPEGARKSSKRSQAIARISGKRSKEISKRVEAQKALEKMDDSYQLSTEELTDSKIISLKTADTPVGNAMRELRGKLIKEFGDEGLVITVLSIGKGGGGSFISINLAAAIAFDESKSSLVIDCNIDRDANGKAQFDDDLSIGLSDYLESDDIDEAEIIQPTGIKRVRYVPSGSAFGNAAEHYNSVKFQQFIDAASSRYENRYIILDAPPVLESADTSILVGLSDAAILVIPYGRISGKQVEDALNIIGRERIMGVVINDEP